MREAVSRMKSQIAEGEQKFAESTRRTNEELNMQAERCEGKRTHQSAGEFLPDFHHWGHGIREDVFVLTGF